jgi:hypothetical protein
MPLDKNTLKVSSSIIKIVGIFESENVKKTISGFKSIGYTSDSLDDDTLGFYKNYWYQEFRDLLFLGGLCSRSGEFSSTLIFTGLLSFLYFIRSSSSFLR